MVSDLITKHDLNITGFEAINTGFLLQQDLNEEIRRKLKKLKVNILSQGGSKQFPTHSKILMSL